MAEDEETTGSEDGESEVETSLEELLQRRERKTTTTSDGDENDEEALIEAMDEREGRAESLTVKVVPPQPSEFTCRGCFLLKHRSQLADKKRMLCRDCA